MKMQIDPPVWFLNDTKDVRSSFYMEEVASEFDVQGLELDWAGVCWDANFYHDGERWVTRAFKGSKWLSVRKPEDQNYLKNAYRVILTRARQGMVIFVPTAEPNDWTTVSSHHDGTLNYLKKCGLKNID